MASTNISLPPPPVFTGDNYEMWAAKMKAYFTAYGLWEIVELGVEPAPLPNNPTVAQIRNYNEEVAKQGKALIVIHSAVNDEVFTRIMTCEKAKEAWDRLKEEFHGSQRTRRIQALNLRREFESLRMKDNETVKEFSGKMMKIVNQIRLLGEELSDQRVVEKMLISLPERFESKIASLEDSRDIAHMSLSELVNSLQATEQRRSLRMEDQVNGALLAKMKGKSQIYSVGKKEKYKREREGSSNSNKEADGRSGKYPPCPNCKKTNHLEKYCWFRPNTQCRFCKEFGHMEKVCKAKKKQEPLQAKAAESSCSTSEEKLFLASCFSAKCNQED